MTRDDVLLLEDNPASPKSIQEDAIPRNGGRWPEYSRHLYISAVRWSWRGCSARRCGKRSQRPTHECKPTAGSQAQEKGAKRSSARLDFPRALLPLLFKPSLSILSGREAALPLFEAVPAERKYDPALLRFFQRVEVIIGIEEFCMLAAAAIFLVKLSGFSDHI